MEFEDDYLLMSGIQHFCFCRRQWALIHIEQGWEENYLTAEGRVQHENCHNKDMFEKRGDVIITRAMRVVSHKLKLVGSCDVVEFHKSADGINLADYDGLWAPVPVEYKHGSEKTEDCDRIQLCAESMALEEMLVCDIRSAYIFYEKTRRRECVELTESLRNTTKAMASEMNNYYESKHTPIVKTSKKCAYCSLKELCLPKISNCDVDGYIVKHISEEE